MIPKVIHYCWFGGNPLPELAKKCIESWKKYCPDFEIKEWNESNFDLNKCSYIKEAYEAKKWAFITDYVRLYVMFNEGGIYMDTDVEVISSIDEFLDNKAFSGFESNTSIPTGIMACEKNFPLFKELLDYYNERHFINEDGSYDLTTNVTIITNLCLKHGLILNNQFQNIDGFTLYPNDYFCPKDYLTGVVSCTNNTKTIHHFSGSWITKEEKVVWKIESWFLKNTNTITGKHLGRFISLPFRIYSKYNKLGFNNTIKFAINKISGENKK